MKLAIWDLAPHLVGEVYDKAFDFSDKGLKIVLEDLHENKAVITYDSEQILGFRYAEETSRNDLVPLVNQAYELARFHKGNTGCFYKAIHSEYNAWLAAMSGNENKLLQAEHHIFFTMDSVFEVLSDKEPHCLKINRERSE
ncbi:hypothetical protein DX933_01030 [Ornithinibacillus gellani]|uniref:hypothetical protein n=1 Tax=Ornithinibacillus gellani TaxID=2293253 RepID=UPI000F48B784|nr:hypothetical protein [Ornithinibacillus gellani]TQS76457.1 hypothetical protein DX933_01030 [Ornithinibacillus gellani]